MTEEFVQLPNPDCSLPQGEASLSRIGFDEWLRRSQAAAKFFAGNPTNAAPRGAHFRGGLSPCVVRRVREYIDSNIDQRIKVEALSKLANLSVCYFVRAFKQSVGVTPHDYLIRRRVERVMKLLSGTDMPLSEIALVAGFADQSHCARRFRQLVGRSPRDYRRVIS
jgi:AraC-like DNA-binding protein